MNARRHTKLVREGSYAAEVDIEPTEEDNGWSRYLSLDDARKLEPVREALRRGDLEQHPAWPACLVSRASIVEPGEQAHAPAAAPPRR